MKPKPTGRTVSQLQLAIEHARGGKSVLYVVADSRHANNVLRTLRWMDEKGRIKGRAFYPSGGGQIEVSFGGGPPTLRSIGTRYFDHHYWETKP